MPNLPLPERVTRPWQLLDRSRPESFAAGFHLAPAGACLQSFPGAVCPDLLEPSSSAARHKTARPILRGSLCGVRENTVDPYTYEALRRADWIGVCRRILNLSGSNKVRSALYPSRIKPRPASPNRCAGRPVILCTASAKVNRFSSRP